MIAVLGGSFDPVHNGHLDLARRVCERYAPKKLYLIPNKQNPLKEDRPGAPAEDRYRMLQLAAGTLAHREIEVVDWEIHREGPSYTWDTLEVVRHWNRDPQILLVVGDEVFRGFHHWHRASELLKSIDVVVSSRTESISHILLEKPITLCGVLDGAWQKSPFASESRYIHTRGRRWVETLTFDALPVSATEIREIFSVYNGSVRPPGIPAPVWDYIKNFHLYSVK